MADMDLFEGRCRLDWWANRSTNLGGIEASVVITPAGTGWAAHGRLISDDDREALASLCAMDPVFTLRFHDGSNVQVVLAQTSDRRFTLTEYTGPEEGDVRPPPAKPTTLQSSACTPGNAER